MNDSVGDMMIKNTFFLAVCLFFFHSADALFFSYANDQDITFKTILTGDCCTSIDYNVINDAYGNIGGNKRLYGIHNMTIEVPGYEVVSLVKNDVCFYPHLFTILGNILSNDNMLVQRWACVKWFLPLSFGFKVQNDLLTISSSIWKYRILSLFRAKESISLVKKADYCDENILDENLKITVSINGRSAVVEQKTIVQVYSLSSLQPLAVLARLLFL